MNSVEFQQLLLTQLRTELAGRYGEFGAIEKRMGRGRGYLSKALCKGGRMPIKAILAAADSLEISIPHFLARALPQPPRPELKLWDIASPKLRGQQLTRLNKVSDRLVADASTDQEDSPVRVLREPPPETRAVRLKLASIERLKPTGIERALATSQKYCDVGFVRSYVKRLNKSIANSSSQAERLAIVIACKVVPALPCSHRERLALFCWVVGLIVDSRHVRGDFSVAARVLLPVLEITQAFGFSDVSGRLLWRAAYLLRDTGSIELAVEATNSAFALFSDNRCPRDLARTHVVRAVIQLRAPDALEKAVHNLQLALTAYGHNVVRGRWRFIAYSTLATASRRLKRFDDAALYLERAIDHSEGLSPLLLGKLHWEVGCLLAERRDLPRAEANLRQAQGLLTSCEAPESAIAAVDLARVLLAQGHDEQVLAFAKTLPALLKLFPRNHAAQRAVSELVEAALENRMSQRVLIAARNRLHKAGPRPKPGGPAFDL